MIDLLIKNTRIVDGTGSPWFHGDVAVQQGMIYAIGRLQHLDAAEVVDAANAVLAPGFIDIHTHSDRTLFAYPTADSRILQGVTTEIGGNCGGSPAPITDAILPQVLESSTPEYGLRYDWRSFGEYLQALERHHTSVNFGSLVGHGALRTAAMGYASRRPTAEEMTTMQSMLKDAIEDGAFGMSSGLIYPPSSYADGEELAELAQAMAPYGGIYATHMRNEGSGLLQSIEDSLAVARKAGVPLHISHLKASGGPANWGKSTQALERLEAARAEGIDVTADQYPYTASANSLTSILPGWVHEGGMESLLARLRNPDTRSTILSHLEKTHLSWGNIVVTNVLTDDNQWVVGKNMQEIADSMGRTPSEAAIELLVVEKGLVRRITFGICEEDIKEIMQSPLVMVGSDGMSLGLNCQGKPHPRSFATFVRILAKYSREEKVLTLEQAVHKMTGLTAARLGLPNRGLIKPGFWADLVLFDPETVLDTPTYTQPQNVPQGIKRVWVNGVLAAQDGQHTGARPGQILRRK